MTALSWDNTGERTYETGVDRGVLYIPDVSGNYTNGVAWNGLTTVTESPTGAEANAKYADNIKYLNLISAEQLEATLEAFTYPVEFEPFDGLVSPTAGVTIGQQTRTSFGLSYRTKKGNDIDGEDYGYKIHLMYGVTAAPTEKAYGTVNDSPEAITFSYKLSTVPVNVTGYKPTALIVIDSTVVDAGELADLEAVIYGSVGVDPILPQPDDVLAFFGGGITLVTATAPTFVSSTGVITIPSVTGVRYRRADTNAIVAAGTVTIGTAGGHLTILAEATTGYALNSFSDSDWAFTRDP